MVIIGWYSSYSHWVSPLWMQICFIVWRKLGFMAISWGYHRITGQTLQIQWVDYQHSQPKLQWFLGKQVKSNDKVVNNNFQWSCQNCNVICMLLIFFTFLYYQQVVPSSRCLQNPPKNCHWAGTHRCCLLDTGRRGAVISRVLSIAFVGCLWCLLDSSGWFLWSYEVGWCPFVKKTWWHLKVYFCICPLIFFTSILLLGKTWQRNARPRLLRDSFLQAKMQHEQNWMSQQLGQFMGHVEV